MPATASELVIAGAFPMVMASVTTALVPVMLLALIATLAVPAAEGVPEIRPVVVLATQPAGKLPILKLVGKLVAALE